MLAGQAGLPATVLLVIVPFVPISIMMVMRNAKKVVAEYWGSYVDLGGSFLEAVQGLTTLKVYQADERWHKRMNDESEGFRRATMKMLRVQLNSINVMDLVAFGGAAAGIAVAVLQLAPGAIGFSGAFLVVFLSQEFFLPMRRLGSLFHTAMNGMSAAKTMFRILDAPVPLRGERELDERAASMPAGAVADAATLESGPAPAQASPTAAGAPSSSRPRRSAFSIMARMIGLVRPLAAHLALAIALGTAGSLAARTRCRWRPSPWRATWCWAPSCPSPRPSYAETPAGHLAMRRAPSARTYSMACAALPRPCSSLASPSALPASPRRPTPWAPRTAPCTCAPLRSRAWRMRWCCSPASP
ncbi:ABC transporter transmembrane domain-containing protein [Collinsella tanakaei]|uniref:ABC transporter transmembrane domain-containing protein n=1 Tax=Collinsella tanakaei TaxID=626935 RepID=UPI0039F4A9EA